MAPHYHSPLLLIFLLIILISFTTTLSRSLTQQQEEEEDYEYTLLDISASLKQTQQVLTFNPQKTLEHFETLTTPQKTQTLTLTLHPRHTLHKHNHKSYTSLVHSRLARDSARVKFLNTKLQLSLNNVNSNNLTPLINNDTVYYSLEAFSTPVTSGATQGSGEYFSRIGVGTPPKPFFMVPDTGSDVSWLQCEPCAECYQQSDPVFNPSGSSSFKQLSCASAQCSLLDVSACRSDRCLYQVAYGDGSYTVGDFVSETLSFGNSGTVRNVALGCGHQNEGLFVGSAGLLGLGGGKLSMPSQISAKSFSYCLVDRNSDRSSTLEFDSVQPVDSIIAPLLKNGPVNTFYYIGLTGISVGGKLVPISDSVFQSDAVSGEGGIIVDSGTAVTRLQTQAYNSLRDSFVSLTKNMRQASGVALFDTCYDLSGLDSVRVPTVSFNFGGNMVLNLPAENYLIPVDESGTFCFAFAPTSRSMSIIGNLQQQGIRVNFDVVNNRVGFSPNKC